MKKQFANNLHSKTFSNKFVLFSVAVIVFIVSIIACVTVVGNTSSNQNSTTITTEAEEATGPTNTAGWWIDEGRYSIEWFTNAQSVVIDGVTYKAGTKQNPYIIATAQDLAGLSWLVYTCGQSGNPLVSGTDYSSAYTFRGKYFKQTANIDLSEYYWQPIGTYYNRSGSTSQHYFSGSYDGGRNAVSGIFTPSGSTNAYSYQGLFGYIYASSSYPITIKNIGITNSNIQGYQYVGGVVGEASASSGTITITNCYNTGSVTGSSYVGGVVGYAVASGTLTITNCYNTGSVSGGGDNVGGVVGYAYVSSSSSAIYISKCANLGDITLTGSSSYVGGIIGYVRVSSASGILQVANCYSEGTIFVQGASATVGGFVGGAYANYSRYSKVYFEFCAVDMNVSTSGGGSISSQGAFYGGINVVTAKNSYSILNGAKSLTSTVNEMDNNFAYILNFKDGKPLPLGLYAISQFGTETNIVERINAL